MNNEKKNKHLTYDDRLEIQKCLCKGMTFKAIWERVEKDQTTVDIIYDLFVQAFRAKNRD